MHDATALATEIRAGRLTAAEVMEATLQACQERAGYGAVVHMDPEMARLGAEAADRLPAAKRGPFHGLPFLVKDLGGVAQGLPASAGSAALRAVVETPTADSDLLASLRASGLIPFGLTATPVFGPSLSCEPEDLPPARNPWNTALTPGGSSGGAAVAVAAGLVAISHATDAAGSIRVPAACCGLTGLKPSRGAVSASPEFHNYLMGIASELVLARSIRDVETAFRTVEQPLAPRVLPEKPRVAVAVPEGCGAAQTHAVRAMADALVDAGCLVRDIASPDALGDEAHRIAWKIIAMALAEFFGVLQFENTHVPPLVAAMADKARAMPSTDLFAMSRDLARLTFETGALFSDCDAVVMPVLSGPPAAVGAFALSGHDLDDHLTRMKTYAPNVALANVAGLPALALPFGLSDGLPLGGQLIGPQGSDAALLKLGAMIEARAPRLQFPHPIAGLPQ